MEIDPYIAAAIENDLLVLGKKIRLSAAKGSDKMSCDFPFLQRVNEVAWHRLIEFAVSADSEKQNKLPPILLHSDENIVSMIGANRQLLLWEEWHFRLYRQFLDYFEIDKSRFRIYHNGKADQQFLSIPNEYGLSPVPNMTASDNKTSIQMDAAIIGNNLYRVENRCAVLWNENCDYQIRNSLEFVATFLAFAFQLFKPKSNCSS